MKKPKLTGDLLDKAIHIQKNRLLAFGGTVVHPSAYRDMQRWAMSDAIEYVLRVAEETEEV